jgi:hypothetical protein
VATQIQIPAIQTKSSPLRILDFDIENRPLAYLGSDYTTGEITAIAWSWVGEDDVHIRVLRPVAIEASTLKMLNDFVAAYNEADIVTGHYIRGHDLPVINGALLEYGLPPLGEKLTSDTKNDLLKRKYISASQEALAAMFELPEPKHHMSQGEWRKANRLTTEGIEATKKRVVDDVLQHKSLRAKLIEKEVLGPPRLWSPF